MKKILLLSLFVCLNVGAESLETHVYESVKPLGKILEGKKGKVVLGTFKSTKASDTCTPSKAINTKISAGLLKAGVKTTASHRAVDSGAEQAEISRVVKLSGGSFIILGTYELAGTKLKIDCSVYDHNGAGVGACEDVAAVTLTAEMIDLINCPVAPAPFKEEKIERNEAMPVVPDTGDSRLKKIDDYICSVIHRDYDLKRLIMSLYEKKMYTLEELKGVRKSPAEDALEVSKEECVTLGNFVLCTDHWNGNGAQVFLGDTTSLGAAKVLSWKHPSKVQVTNSARCLKKDDNWWNP